MNTKTIKFYLCLTSILSMLLQTNCKKTDEKVPEVVTVNSSSSTLSTIKCSGKVVSDNGSALMEWGICWSDKSTPTIRDNKKSDSISSILFTVEITGLQQNTAYHVRAYATTEKGTGYGEEYVFSTKSALYTESARITDVEGNEYKTIKIGNQTWMAENLKTKHYSEGTLIDTATNPDMIPYQNDIAVYGRLYSWYVASDNRNVCPIGWHVPSNSEWTILTDLLGEEAGYKMKESGSLHWENDNYGSSTSGTNESGLTVLPVKKGINGNLYAIFWTSTPEENSGYAFYRMIGSDKNGSSSSADKMDGSSIRCVKDN
jgi:uncharacterized protein (TIGR02145 family)